MSFLVFTQPLPQHTKPGCWHFEGSQVPPEPVDAPVVVTPPAPVLTLLLHAAAPTATRTDKTQLP
jgi:hypothetical protein